MWRYHRNGQQIKMKTVQQMEYELSFIKIREFIVSFVVYIMNKIYRPRMRNRAHNQHFQSSSLFNLFYVYLCVILLLPFLVVYLSFASLSNLCVESTTSTKAWIKRKMIEEIPCLQAAIYSDPIKLNIEQSYQFTAFIKRWSQFKSF